MMTNLSDDRVVELLRETLPPAAAEIPQQDLWPRVHRRLDRSVEWPSTTDYALIAAVVVACLLRPSVLGLLLLHL